MGIQVTDNKKPSFVAYKTGYQTENPGVGAKVILPSDAENPLLKGGQENKQDAKQMKKIAAEVNQGGCCNMCAACDALIEAHEEVLHIEQKKLTGSQMMQAIAPQQNLIHMLISIVGYCMLLG